MMAPANWMEDMKAKNQRHAAAYRYVESFLPGFMANAGLSFISEEEYDAGFTRPGLLLVGLPDAMRQICQEGQGGAIHERTAPGDG